MASKKKTRKPSKSKSKNKRASSVPSPWSVGVPAGHRHMGHRASGAERAVMVANFESPPPSPWGYQLRPKKKGKSQLTDTEKAVQRSVKRAVDKALRDIASAGRLPAARPRKAAAPKARAAAAPAPAPKASKPRPRKSKPPTMTADQVLRAAETKALQRWVCEGARRSGCGAGGSRVVTASGSFKRLRPPRFMSY